MHTTVAKLPAAGLALLLAGCAGAELEPASSAHSVAYLDEAARARSDDVTMVASTKEYTHGAEGTRAVTPLHLELLNSGERPVRIRYEDFRLVDDEGRVYRPLPPVAVAGHLRLDPAERGHTFDRFELAPPRRSPSGYWKVGEGLPTPEMMVARLPQGVLRSGGYVSGWLYFEEVDEDEAPITLQAELASPRGETVARLAIELDEA